MSKPLQLVINLTTEMLDKRAAELLSELALKQKHDTQRGNYARPSRRPTEQQRMHMRWAQAARRKREADLKASAASTEARNYL